MTSPSPSTDRELTAFHKIQSAAYIRRLALLGAPIERIKERAIRFKSEAQPWRFSQYLLTELKAIDKDFLTTIRTLGLTINPAIHSPEDLSRCMSETITILKDGAPQVVSKGVIIDQIANSIHSAWLKSSSLLPQHLLSATVSDVGNTATRVQEPLYQDRIGAIQIAYELSATIDEWDAAPLRQAQDPQRIEMPDPPPEVTASNPPGTLIPHPLNKLIKLSSQEPLATLLNQSTLHSVLGLVPLVTMNTAYDHQRFCSDVRTIADTVSSIILARHLAECASLPFGYQYITMMSSVLRRHINGESKVEKLYDALDSRLIELRGNYTNENQLILFELQHYRTPQALKTIQQHIIDLSTTSSTPITNSFFASNQENIRITIAVNPTNNTLYGYSIRIVGAPHVQIVVDQNRCEYISKDAPQHVRRSLELGTLIEQDFDDYTRDRGVKQTATQSNSIDEALEQLFQIVPATSVEPISAWDKLLYHAHLLGQQIHEGAHLPTKKESDLQDANNQIEYSTIPFKLKHYGTRTTIETIQEKLIAIASRMTDTPNSVAMNQRGGVRLKSINDDFFSTHADELDIVIAHDSSSDEIIAFSIVHKPGTTISNEFGKNYHARNPVFFRLYGKNDSYVAPPLTPHGRRYNPLSATLLATEVNVALRYGTEIHIGTVWGDNLPSQRVLLECLGLSIDISHASHSTVWHDGKIPLVRDMSRGSLLLNVKST